MKTATLKGNTIEIRFPFSWETVTTVKTVPNRRFHDSAGQKYWSCPVSPEAVRILLSAGFSLDKQLMEHAKHALSPTLPGLITPQAPSANTAKPVALLPLPPLKKTLYPFQHQGVQFIESRNGRVLLGDEMGLGKTIQALAWLRLHPEKRPTIILCPAHLKLNWEREIRQTIVEHQNVQIVFGTDTSQPLTGAIIIINYDVLHRGWVEPLLALNPQVLVIDEAHYARNSSALRTKATRKLARKIPHVLALTGTPIVNRPIDGFNIIQMVRPGLFPNFMTYAHRYCAARHNGFGWDFGGSSNEDELHRKLTGTIMLRRLKADVLQDLPEKTRGYIPLELDNAKEYNEAESDFIRFLRRHKGADAAERARAAEYLVKIETLKQLSVAGKIARAIEWIQDFIDDNGKLVVFAVHKSTIDKIMAAFASRAVKIDGSVSASDRDKAVQAFQQDDRIRLLVGNIQAAGTGITLTAASSVAFVELPWTSGELSQAEDRCHRIGQKNAVNIYYLLTQGTIEERIARLLDSKRRVLSSVLDGKEVEDQTLLSSLIREYTEQHDNA